MRKKRIPLPGIIVLTLIIHTFHKTLALQCYNSDTVDPRNIVECNPEENCYGEYFAVERELGGELYQRVDRFCVHEIHCQNRGLTEKCVSATELDPVVRKTFDRKLMMSRIPPDNLMHSRFCCCTQDLCNSLSKEEIKTLFNITASTTQTLPNIFVVTVTVLVNIAHLPF